MAESISLRQDLLRLNPGDAARYFVSLITEVSESQAVEINTAVMNHVCSGALIPAIYRIWLTNAVKKHPCLLKEGLFHKTSRGVRLAAIRSLKGVLRSAKWRNVWDVIGGAAGWKGVFDFISVAEVSILAGTIGRCVGKNDDERAQAVEELAELLIPGLTGGKRSSTGSDRALSLPLMPLFRGCRHEFMARVLCNIHNNRLPVDRLFLRLSVFHVDFLRRIAIGSIAVDPCIRQKVLQSSVLLRVIESPEPYQSTTFPRKEPLPSRLGFSFDLLDIFQSDGMLDIKIPTGRLLQSFAETVKLAIRTKVEFSDILAFLESVLAAKAHFKLALYDWEPLLVFIIQFWTASTFPKPLSADRQQRRGYRSRPQKTHQARLETVLKDALSTLRHSTIRTHSLATLFLREFSRLISATTAEGKLPLVKLICRYVPGLDIDLDSSALSEKEAVRLPWSMSFILTLPEQHSKWMFERVNNLGAGDRAWNYESLSKPWFRHRKELFWFNQRLFEATWEARSSNIPRRTLVAEELIKKCGGYATGSRDADDRRKWARRAIDIALLSKSLRVYGSTVKWSRRFLNDWSVNRELMKRIFSEEAKRILACEDVPYGYYTSLDKLAKVARKVNEVLVYHLELARLLLRQESYQPAVGRNMMAAIRHVVSARIKTIGKLCDSGSCTEGDLVDVLLEPLKPLILEIESSDFSENSGALSWGGLPGILDGLYCPSTPREAVLDFLDRLATERDLIWTEERAKKGSKWTFDVEGWPKGLPVQYLMPSAEWTAVALTNESFAPFVSARVKEVAFGDPDLLCRVINQSDHSKSLGVFADSLTFAIRAYIGDGSEADQETKLEQVWEHYTNSISADFGHMKSFREWCYDFAKDRGLNTSPYRKETAPQAHPVSLKLFDNVHGGQTISWDSRPAEPDADTKPNIHTYPLTGLRYRFSATKDGRRLENLMEIDSTPNPWTTAEKITPKTITRFHDAAKRSPREVQVLSALLYIHRQSKSEESLLFHGFPTSGPYTRYPPVRLDVDFVSDIQNDDHALDHSFYILKKNLQAVPAPLLQNMVLSFQKRMLQLPENSWKLPNTQINMIRLLRLLKESDQPMLAVDPALNVIKDLQQASYRHRSTLTPGLARRLHREGTETMVRQFADFIIESLGKSKKQSQGDTEGKPHVKITTVKMLAQLVADGDVIPTTSQTNILRSLFEASQHIDVRVAVCNALLSVIARDDNSAEPYELLKSWVLTAARPNERVNTTEEQWLQAENGGALPDISSERPLLNLFIESVHHNLPSQYREDYVRTAVIPLVQEISRQHRRWMLAFLRQVGSITKEDSIPNIGPFDPDLTAKVRRIWAEYLPRTFLLDDRQSATSYVFCLRHRDVNGKISTPQTQSLWANAWSHWNRFFAANSGISSAIHLRRLWVAIDTKVADGITEQDIHDEYFERISFAIRHPFNFESSVLRVSTSAVMAEIKQLHGSSKALVPLLGQRVIRYINSLRTDEWIQNPSRSPPVLPTPFEIEVASLPLPHNDQTSESRYETFASSLISLIDRHIESPTWLAGWKQVKDVIEEVKNNDIIECVLALGKNHQASRNSLTQYLRVELANTLLEKVKRAQWDSNGDMHAMIDEWKKSSNESVRRMGWEKDGRVDI